MHESYDPSNPLGITDEEVKRYPLYVEGEQCAAAHDEDQRECVGAFDAVTVIDGAGAETGGCVLHAAVALKSLVNARVRRGAEPGAALAAYELAKEIPPFAWRGGLAQERAVELRARYVRTRENGTILCAHADLDGQGGHWLKPGEKCVVSDIEKPESTERPWRW